ALRDSIFMCGIVGKVNFDRHRLVDPAQIESMADSVRHRGPDDGGTWLAGNVGLGHKRLSIIDLSPSGRNPMCNEDSTVWIVFNGEVYNFRELRPQWEERGNKFKSRADTEGSWHCHQESGPNGVRHLGVRFPFA